MSAVTEDNSGILQEHITKIVKVAKEQKCFIFIRPVNKYATKLIKAAYGGNNPIAVKGLDIHGKSADWGYQAGFIPEDQRLSKLTEEGQIEKGNKSVKESLTKTNIGTVQLALTTQQVKEAEEDKRVQGVKETTKGKEVRIVKKNTRMEVAYKLTKKQGVPDKWFVTYKMEDGNMVDFKPLMVLGYKNKQGEVTPVTADYDIFAICPHWTLALMGKKLQNNSIKFITNTKPSGEFGTLSKLQDNVRIAINNECRKEGFLQEVVKHGTELNNPFPEFDETYAMFLPGGGSKVIKGLKKAEQTTGDITGKTNIANLFTLLAVHGFHVYVNEYWPVTWRAEIGAKIATYMQNPSWAGAVLMELGAEFKGVRHVGEEVITKIMKEADVTRDDFKKPGVKEGEVGDKAFYTLYGIAKAIGKGKETQETVTKADFDAFFEDFIKK